jgi:hypothetical protein
MRRIRYQVACSLDGYIAGPDAAGDPSSPLRRCAGASR